MEVFAETKEFFLVPIDQRDRPTLLRCIQDYIEPGTTIISDCWRAYSCLSDEGFVHYTVNHSLNFVDPVTGAHTNGIERRWREVKKLVPSNGRRKENFVAYLALAYFKIVYKEHRHRLHAFLKAAAELYPPAQ